MFHYNPLDCLPSAEDLPDSDDTPVDGEQNVFRSIRSVIASAQTSQMLWESLILE